MFLFCFAISVTEAALRIPAPLVTVSANPLGHSRILQRSAGNSLSGGRMDTNGNVRGDEVVANYNLEADRHVEPNSAKGRAFQEHTVHKTQSKQF